MSTHKLNQSLTAAVPKGEAQSPDHLPPSTAAAAVHASSSSSSSSSSHHELHNLSHLQQQNKEPNDLKDDSHSCDHHQHPPIKWMSSKMRLMRRMMTGTSDHHLIAHELAEQRSRRRRSGRLTITNESKIETCDDQSHVMSMIRTCSHCSTTTTPLWRSGPRGPKSLCNACGIRQMKARRALADHEQGSGGAAEKMKKASRKEKIMIRSSELDPVVPYKKRFRYFMNHAGDDDHDQDQEKKMKIRKSSPAAFRSAFPQDEKEAAVLLMALSCGMIHG